MPWIRRTRLRKPITRRRRGLVRRRLPLARRLGVSRAVTFTETYKLTTLYNNGVGANAPYGVLKVKLNDIAQVTQYQDLYNQYCIKSATLIVVPQYDEYAAQTAAAGTYNVTAPRMVYAINDSAQQATPVNELDVLQDNGAKIRMLTRPFKIKFRPVAEVALGMSTGGFVSESKHNRWLSFNDPEVLHSGVAYAIPQLIAGTSLTPICSVYVNLTFACKDPK